MREIERAVERVRDALEHPTMQSHENGRDVRWSTVRTDDLRALLSALEIAEAALTKIKTDKPSEIVPGIVHGPALMWDNAKRHAADALRKMRRPLPPPPKDDRHGD